MTQNKSVKRIHFYTGKVAKLFAVHPVRRNDFWDRRAARLKQYKAAMHQEFKKDGIT